MIKKTYKTFLIGILSFMLVYNSTAQQTNTFNRQIDSIQKIIQIAQIFIVSVEFVQKIKSENKL